MNTNPLPRHIIWSTHRLHLSDPFQRRRSLHQVLLHGRAQDVRALNFQEFSKEIDNLDLPDDLHRLWKQALEALGAGG
jgi:hypothetical protein